MSDTVLKIEGMACKHCKAKVENALKAVGGVTGVSVDLAKKEAVIAGSADKAALTKAVTDAGYKVIG